MRKFAYFHLNSCLIALLLIAQKQCCRHIFPIDMSWHLILKTVTHIPWVQVVDISEKISKALGIAVARLFAYYKDFRGRTFGPRSEINLSLTVLSANAQEFSIINAVTKNTGLSKVVFNLGDSALHVFAANDSRNSQRANVVEWRRLATVGLSERHKWVEPAETIRENLGCILGAQWECLYFQRQWNDFDL